MKSTGEQLGQISEGIKQRLDGMDQGYKALGDKAGTMMEEIQTAVKCARETLPQDLYNKLYQ
jgi:hypothetical protein